MKIGLDTRLMNNSGIGTTIRCLLENLNDEQKRQLVLLNPNYKIYGATQHLLYPPLLRREKLDLFHMPHFDVPALYHGKFIATVHDLIHVIFPQYSNKPFSKAYALWRLRHVAEEAVQIITVSTNTKMDLLKYFPQAERRIRVIHPSVDTRFHVQDENEVQSVLKRHQLTAGYLLYVGNIRKSKNSPGLLKAYALLREKFPDAPPLVLVGMNSFKEYERSGFPKGVRHLDFVSNEDLPALYQGAAVFVFPSFYEGFGLPPVEAMACGTPVVTSRVASLPEVCGEAAVFIDPHQPESLAQGLESLLFSKDLQQQCRAKGLANVKRFEGRRYASEVWSVYEQALH